MKYLRNILDIQKVVQIQWIIKTAPYLISLATLVEVDLETFCLLRRIIMSLGCNPAASAGDARSTRPTLTGHASITVNPNPFLPRCKVKVRDSAPQTSLFTAGILELAEIEKHSLYTWKAILFLSISLILAHKYFKVKLTFKYLQLFFSFFTLFF